MMVIVKSNSKGEIRFTLKDKSRVVIKQGVNTLSKDVITQCLELQTFNYYLSKGVFESTDTLPSDIGLHSEEEEEVIDWPTINEDNYSKESLDKYAETFGIKLNRKYKFDNMVLEFKKQYEIQECVDDNV